MADYINSNILCQGYVHVDGVELSEEQLSDLRERIRAYLESRAEFFLYSDIEADVQLKDGSLKLYGTILGALYLAIGNYGDFRSGAEYVYQDVKRLADCVTQETLFLTQSRRDAIIRIEARTGVVGKLKQVIDDIARIRSDLEAEGGAAAAGRRLNLLTDEAKELIDQLKDPADVTFVSEGLCKLVDELLPDNPPNPRKRPNTQDEVQHYREERRKLRAAFGGKDPSSGLGRRGPKP